MKMSTKGMSLRSDRAEAVVADNGYSGPRCLRANNLKDLDLVYHGCMQARHEAADGRLKHFIGLSSQFRRRVDIHLISFHAVSQVTAVLSSACDKSFFLDHYVHSVDVYMRHYLRTLRVWEIFLFQFS